MKNLFKKITKNYALSMTLACAIFALTYAFASIYQAKSFLSLLGQYSIVLPRNVMLLLLCSLFIGGVMLAVYAVIVKLFLTIFKIYTIPYSEALFVTLLVFSVRNLLLGCLNLVILFSPVAFTWGSGLFFILSTLPFVVILYYIFDKYYIHISASPLIFKTYCIFWVIVLVLRLFVSFGFGF